VGDLTDLRSEDGRELLAIAEVARANEHLRAEVAQLKQWIDELEQENQRIAEANEVVKRDIGEVSDSGPKVKEGLMKSCIFDPIRVANLVQWYWLRTPMAGHGVTPAPKRIGTRLGESTYADWRPAWGV
jgi:hypothetical protein